MSEVTVEELFKLEYADYWVREAVCDSELSRVVFERASAVIDAVDQRSELEIGLALHYIRGLSGRHLLSSVSDALRAHERVGSSWLERDNPLWGERDAARILSAPRRAREELRDGVSRFAPLVSVYARPTLGMSALDLISELAPPQHPAKLDAQRYVSARLDQLNRRASQDETQAPSLRAWLWDHLDAREDLSPLLTHAARCLSEKPERGITLAVRLALVQPEQALRVCVALRSLERVERARFAARLEKQLKRVGRIKLWVRCRDALQETS